MAWTTPGTAVAGDVLTAAFWNTQVRDNMNAIGTWTTWSPTLTGITLGNGLLETRYIQAGKTVAFHFYFKLGSTSAISPVAGVVGFTLPSAARFTADFSQALFPGVIHDNGTENYGASGVMGYSSTSTSFVDICVNKVDTTYATVRLISATIPMTWATNDKIVIDGMYEAA